MVLRSALGGSEGSQGVAGGIRSVSEDLRLYPEISKAFQVQVSREYQKISDALRGSRALLGGFRRILRGGVKRSPMGFRVPMER